MDTVVEKAKKRLAEMEAEISELNSFLRTYAKLEGSNTPSDVSPPRIPPAAQTPKVPTLPVIPNAGVVNGERIVGKFIPKAEILSSKDEIVEAARSVLKANYPNSMHITDLYNEVVNLGIKIGGQNPKGNFSAKLAPPDDLKYIKDRGWIYEPS